MTDAALVPAAIAAGPVFHRFVALGDSFAEGVGDPDPAVPGGLRGWADRVAEVLAARTDDFGYANLAVRGRLLGRILDEQLEPALALAPDLVALSAGGNDVIRPGSDPDALAARLEPGVAALAATGATVVLFVGVDTAFSPVFRHIRGKVAILNENLRVIARRHGVLIADQWGLTAIQDPEMWTVDRLHLNRYGHHAIAREVLSVLGVPNELEPDHPAPPPPRSWREARVQDLAWTKEYLIPWIGRRIRGTSSGDLISPKRPGY